MIDNLMETGNVDSTGLQIEQTTKNGFTPESSSQLIQDHMNVDTMGNDEDNPIDIPSDSNENDSMLVENGHFPPVPNDTSGEGLPYAPQDFPNPGDKWRWRVGKRVAIEGHYLDRYLYPPKSILNSKRKKNGFASKLAVERYLKSEFPDADIDAFFASFSWKIPSKQLKLVNGTTERRSFFTVPHEDTAENMASDSPSDLKGCKAYNKMCSSLIEQSDETQVMPCDICCTEPGFCRDCCCILCCKTIDSACGGYSYIKCEALVDEDSICGHIAHLNCALRAYMAGTVGGSIGLDAEYYCRRCDARTDLVFHVKRLLEFAKSIDSCDELEKVLTLGVCILHGSQKAGAKMLLNSIECAFAKLKSGAAVEDIWKEDSQPAISDNGDSFSEVAFCSDLLDANEDISLDESIPFNYQIQSLKLENDIDLVLQELRKSQEYEYKIAEECLHAQKNYLHNLYQQLEHETSQPANPALPVERNDGNSLKTVWGRKNQIKRELKKLDEMKKVAKGFGKCPKAIAKEHFGLKIED